jgi:membrane-bound lytic murein transglycosylase D
MVKRKHLASTTYAVLLGVLFTVTAYVPAKAQIKKDSTKKILLAKLDKKEVTTITIKEANVIYPDLLAGNEEQSLEYIEKFSTNRRDYLIRTYNKGKKFFPKAAKILKKHRIPEEFKVLLALESAFNGNAVSGAGAVGYWQIMDEVAKEYGLTYVAQPTAEEKKAALVLAKTEVTKEKAEIKKEIKKIVKDDRKDFNKATNTAARYLKDRCRNLDNNWLLIVASYNCGVGNVWNAMKKTGKANPDFWDVKNYLPAETRAYVMNFIALNVVFNNYQKFASNTLNFKAVKIMGEDLEEDMKDGDGETTLNNK